MTGHDASTAPVVHRNEGLTLGAMGEQPTAGVELPATGTGAVAGFGRRFAAIVVDWVPCALAALLLTENPSWSALMIFLVLTVTSVAVFGRTPGHAAAGIRIAELDSGGRPSFVAALVRSVLLCLVVPALIVNSDGRGLHDRIARTVVLRAR